MPSSVLSALLSFQCLFTMTGEELEEVVTIDRMAYYEDKTCQLTFDDIIPLVETGFSRDPNFQPAKYNVQSAYWIHFRFCIEEDRNYLVEFYDQTIDSLSVYLKQDTSDFVTHLFGDKLLFKEKPFKHKNFLIELTGRGEYELIARVKNENYADIRLSVKTVNHFLRYAINEYYVYGIFYGMILIISLYNASIYGAIREQKYLYYTFYILSVALFAMCMDGIGYQYLWPSYPVWNNIAHGVALFSVIFWIIVFSKEFLVLKTRAPRVNRILSLVLVLRTALFIYALFFDHALFNFRNIEIIPLSLIFLGSVYSFRSGYKPARFFIVANGFLFIGFITKAMIMLSVIPFDLISSSQTLQIVTYYSIHISFVLEMLFLSLALTDRVRILKENRDKAQLRIIQQHEASLRYKDILNSQLEERIKERTAEIESKNQMLLEVNENLEQQKREISEINSMLDLDNFRLTNDIQAIQKERLLNKELTFEEFQNVFKKDDSLLEILAEYKWSIKYTCVRCGNKKYSEGQISFSRRCTKCGYQESPTTNTLFHRIKFPLVKAFYIYYDSMNENTYSLTRLSVMLELRKNTVWNFKKKIESHTTSENEKLYEVFNKTQKS